MATKKKVENKTEVKKTATQKDASKSAAKKVTEKASVKKDASKGATKKVSDKATAKKDSSKIPAKKDAAKDLKSLYESGLKDIYWAEKNLLKALPEMEKNATSNALKKGIAKHTLETKGHIKRLESCFKELGVKAEAERCDAMAGLLDEAEGIMEETVIGSVRDAGIIAASQKVEHYEIATYGTLAAFAKVLGYKESLKLLLKTLGEEKQCDEDLSNLADTALNTKAK